MTHSISRSEYKKGILIRTITGEVSAEDIVALWENEIREQVITPSHVGVVTDYRDAEITFDTDGLDLIEQLILRHPELARNIKIAPVIDTPKVIIPIILRERYPYVRLKVFSTVEAAVKWIMY